MGVVEGEEADRGRDTTRARAEKEEPRRARDNQDWRNAGKRKGEKQKKGPHPHPGEAVHGARLQGAGPGVALLPKEPSAPSLPPLLPTHTPLPPHVWLARKEGAAPLCSGTANLAENLADGAGSFGSGPPTGLHPKSAPNWVTMMQAQRCIPNPHPHPNLCTHPPSVPTAEMRRDHERQIGKRPHHTMAHHD